MMKALVLLAVSSIVVFPLALCFSNGTSRLHHVCKTLKPHHNKSAPQTGAAPFQVTAASDRVPSGAPVLVSLESITGTPFKGFMLQARPHPVRKLTPFGTFRLLDATRSKLMVCASVADATATHNSPVPKTHISFQWLPPKGFQGQVFFEATFVQSFAVFWTKLLKNVTIVPAAGDWSNDAVGQSDDIADATGQTDDNLSNDIAEAIGQTDDNFNINIADAIGQTDDSSSNDIGDAIGQTDDSSNHDIADVLHDLDEVDPASPFQDVYDGCGSMKQCFGVPQDCEQTGACQTLVSISLQITRFEFEFIGSDSEYVAINLTRKESPCENLIVQCVLLEEEVVMNKVYPIDEYNSLFTDNIQLVHSSFVDGSIRCGFIQNHTRKYVEFHEFGMETYSLELTSRKTDSEGEDSALFERIKFNTTSAMEDPEPKELWSQDIRNKATDYFMWLFMIWRFVIRLL